MKNSAKFTASMLFAATILGAAGGASAFLGMFEDEQNPYSSERRSPALNNSSAQPPMPQNTAMPITDPYSGYTNEYSTGYSMPAESQQYAMLMPAQPMDVPAPPAYIPTSPAYSAQAYSATTSENPLMQPQGTYVGEDGYPKLSSIPQNNVQVQQPLAQDPRLAEMQAEYNQSQAMAGNNEYVQIPQPPQFPEVAPANPGMQQSYAAPMQQSYANEAMPNYAASVTNEYAPQFAGDVTPVFPSGPSVTVRSKRAGATTMANNNAPANIPAYEPVPMQAAPQYSPAPVTMAAPATVFTPEQNFASANQPAPVFPSGPSVTVRSKRSGGGATYNPAPEMPVMPEVAALGGQEVYSAPAPQVASTPLVDSANSFEVASVQQPMETKVVGESYTPMTSSYDNPLVSSASYNPSAFGSYTVGAARGAASPFMKKAKILPPSRYAKYRRTGEK